MYWTGTIGDHIIPKLQRKRKEQLWSQNSDFIIVNELFLAGESYWETLLVGKFWILSLMRELLLYRLSLDVKYSNCWVSNRYSLIPKISFLKCSFRSLYQTYKFKHWDECLVDLHHMTRLMTTADNRIQRIGYDLAKCQYEAWLGDSLLSKLLWSIEFWSTCWNLSSLQNLYLYIFLIILNGRIFNSYLSLSKYCIRFPFWLPLLVEWY